MGSSSSSNRPGRLKAKLGAIHFFLPVQRNNNFVQADDIPLHSLSRAQKELLQKHFYTTLLDGDPDLFERTLLEAIQSSKSLKNVVMENYQCDGPDIFKWQAISAISNMQRQFYDKIIHIQNLDRTAVGVTIFTYGTQNFHFCPKNFNPHFVDIWMRLFEKNVSEYMMEEEHEKEKLLTALKHLNGHILYGINQSYRATQQSLKKEQQMSARERANSVSNPNPSIQAQACSSSNLAVMHADGLSLSTSAL